jgi:nitrate/TMAO reductase-like tetraheme cytochrome c subunit
LFFVAFSAGSVELTSQSWFCNSCHIMEPYYSTWHTSSHKDVECVRCHIPPGLNNFVSAKLNGAGQVVDDLLNRTNTKPSAVVSDASCTRAGCHSIEKIKTTTIDKKFKFDHGKHLGLEYQGITIHCTTCHSHVKADKHFDVNLTTCITCHMNKQDAIDARPARLVEIKFDQTMPTTAAAIVARTDAASATAPIVEVATATAKTPSRQCKTCHNPPQQEINFHGLKVNHIEYVAYGAACESCHNGVTENPKPIKDEQCYGCHEFGREKITSVAETHQVHSGGGHHKVECFNCHGIAQHGPDAQKVQTDRLVCQNCHRGQHAVQQFNYKRTEEEQVTLMSLGHDSPQVKAVSPMFLAHVACTGCHIQAKPERNRPGSGATVTVASAKACDNCHRSGAGEQVPLWQKNTKALYESVNKMLPPADQKLDERQQKLVEEAQNLLTLVKVDGSWGVHNPRYTQRLLEQAQKNLTEVTKPAAAAEKTP